MSSPERAPILQGAAPDTKESPRISASRLLLVRHGESTWNREHKVQGQHDPPLSPLGLEQARRLATRLAGERLAAFYSSDLRRAWQTAEAVAAELGLQPVPLPGLREIALGAWEGKTREELVAEYPAEWEAWARHPSWDLVPGGEGAAPFERRVLTTLAGIQADHPTGDVLCLTHGGFIQVALGSTVAPGRGSDGTFPFRIDNCSISAFLRTDRRTVVTAVNDTCHLS
jgi:broad specificity phosphatase PhoE